MLFHFGPLWKCSAAPYKEETLEDHSLWAAYKLPALFSEEGLLLLLLLLLR